MSICNFKRIGSNDSHVGNNTSKNYRKRKKNVVKAFDLEICFVAKEAGLQLGQQSAFR